MSLDEKPGTFPVHSHMCSVGSLIRTGQHLNLSLRFCSFGQRIACENRHVLAVAFSLSDLLKFHERQADDGDDGDNGDDGKEGVVLGDAP